VIRAHTQAILDRLAAHHDLTDAVYEGATVPVGTKAYVTVWADSGRRHTDRLAGPSTVAEFTFTVHSVGSQPEQAQAIAECVFTQLIDWTPDIPGYAPRRMRHTATVPTTRDPDGRPPVYYCTDEFTLTTQPTP